MEYKTSHRITLPSSQLEPGMYVAELDRPWEETPFLFQGFLLESYDDVDTVREYADTVVIDKVKYVNMRTKRPEKRTRGPLTRRPARKKTVEQALPRAEKTVEGSSRLIRSVMDDVRLGKAIDTAAAKEAVSECVDNILDNPDAMTLLTRIRNKDEYTSQHSLSVSVLSISLGRTLGLARDQLEALGMAAMLHDVGKIMTPDEVLKKPGRLTDQEMEVMKRHAREGRDILLSTDGVTLEALDVAHSHHERMDGGGYPRGLKKDQLSLFTRMVSVTDTFDAITSDRVYDNGRTNIEAFKILSRGSASQWDSQMVLQFIRTIGIYPPGTVVELSSGELGIVIETNPGMKLRPKVLLLPRDGQPVAGSVVIDLAITPEDMQGRPLTIARVHNARKLGIDLHDLKQQGLLAGMNPAA